MASLRHLSIAATIALAALGGTGLAQEPLASPSGQEEASLVPS